MKNKVYILVLENAAWGYVVDILGVFTDLDEAKKFQDEHNPSNVRLLVQLYESDFYVNKVKKSRKV